MQPDLRINWVKVATSQTVIEIPWASREALLGRLRIEGADDLVRKFEAVGTTRALELDEDGERRLRGSIIRWHDEHRGRLPEGIAELRDVLIDR